MRLARIGAPIVAIAAAVVLIFAFPSRAIVHGQDDEGRHPAVACVAGTMPDGSFAVSPYSGSSCFSGQLISPTVVLTDAHVLSLLGDEGATQVVVTFAPSLASATTFYGVVQTAVDPGWTPSLYREDLAVLILDRRVEGISPLLLPAAGQLDSMRGGRGLAGLMVTVAGFGCQGYGSQTGFVGCDDVRRVASESVNALNRESIKVQTNQSATDGGGGMCWGDSGSPLILPDGQTTVGASAWMTTCASAATATRLDTAAARDFLGAYVTLP